MASKYNFKPNIYNFKIIFKNPEHNSPKSESVNWLDLFVISLKVPIIKN